MTTTDQLFAHTATVTGLDEGALRAAAALAAIDAAEAAGLRGTRTDRHMPVSHSRAVLDHFSATGNQYSGGFCADPTCGRFLTASIHYRPDEPEWQAEETDGPEGSEDAADVSASSNCDLDEEPYRLLLTLADASHRTVGGWRPVFDCLSHCPACLTVAGLVPNDERYALVSRTTGAVLLYDYRADRWVDEDRRAHTVAELAGLDCVPVPAALLGVDVERGVAR